MKMPNVLKISVWKFKIAHLIILNNYSKCLMCASTALQTSLKHIVFGNTQWKSNINQPPSPFWLTLFVECESQCSYFGVIYTSLKWFTVIIITIWHHRQTWHYFITAVCYSECRLTTFNMAGIHDIGFFDTQFLSNCYFYIHSSFALIIHNAIQNMLYNCVV